jgi:hypothetical protein
MDKMDFEEFVACFADPSLWTGLGGLEQEGSLPVESHALYLWASGYHRDQTLQQLMAAVPNLSGKQQLTSTTAKTIHES